MPTQTFTLPDAQTLLVTSSRGWRNIRLSLNDVPLEQTPSAKELAAGTQFVLPGGRTLALKLHRSQVFGSSSGLEARLDGALLPGSTSNDQVKLADGAGCVTVVGVVSVVLGLFIVMASPMDGLMALFFGLIYLVLSYFIRRRSQVAMILAITLYVMDTVIYVVSIVQGQMASFGIAGVIVRGVILFAILFPSYKAMRNLEKQVQV